MSRFILSIASLTGTGFAAGIAETAAFGHLKKVVQKFRKSLFSQMVKLGTGQVPGWCECLVKHISLVRLI